MSRDAVDRIVAQWRRERPELDGSPMEVLGRVTRLHRVLRLRLEEEFARHGLTGEQFDVLATLRRQGRPYALSPTRLFRAMMLSSGAMTNRLDRLEENGWIERRADPDDRRGSRVTLTGSGRALVDRAIAGHLANEKRLLDGLTRAERSQLATLCRKWLASLEGALRESPGDGDDR